MAITYSIDGGADAAKFNINGTSGALTFKAAPDFEAPGDANGDNVYEVSVKATDAGGLSTSKLVKVTVTDVSEGSPPQITSAGAVTVKENSTTVMTVTATDPDDGTQPPIPPVETGDIPLVWEDPRFNSSVIASTTSLSRGSNMSNKSYSEQSGNPTITCAGNNILDTVRVKSREAIRVGGSGMFEYRNCYLEAKGSGADHADVIQAYSPGNKGTIKLVNSHIRAYNTAATAGLFVADDWTGTIDIQNTIFQGGPYGLRVHPDSSGDNIIIMRDVFFVGPFGAGPFYFTDVAGHRNIFQTWENVCNATIVNGRIVPGTQIPKPS